MQERKAWRMTDSTFGQDSGEQRVVAYAAFDAAGGDAARRLSEDFAQALAAYEELSRRQLPHPAPRLAAERIERTEEAGQTTSAWPAETRPLERLVVIASDPDTALSDTAAALTLLGRRGELGADARVWGLVASERHRPDDAAIALETLGASLGGGRGTWMGGVALGGGRLALPAAGRPRMGRLRERASVAIDGLIGAVRCGISLDEAAPLFGFETERGVLAAPIGISRAEYLVRVRMLR